MARLILASLLRYDPTLLNLQPHIRADRIKNNFIMTKNPKSHDRQLAGKDRKSKVFQADHNEISPWKGLWR